MALSMRKPFSPRTTPGNESAVDRVGAKNRGREAAKRDTNDENVAAGNGRSCSRDKCSPRLTRPRSAPALPVVPAETPVASAEACAEEENAVNELVADAVKTAVEALSRGSAELLPVFELLLVETESSSTLRHKVAEIGLKNNDFQNNEAKLRVYLRELTKAFAKTVDQNKALLKEVATIQQALTDYLRKKHEEAVALQEQHEAAKAEWMRQSKQQLDTAELILQEIIAAKNRKEAKDAQTIHPHQCELAQVTANLESSRQELAKTREDLSATRAQLDAKSEQLASVSQAKTDLEIKHNSYKENHNTSNEEQTRSIAELKVMVAVKTAGLEQNQCEITELKKRLQEEEKRRRDMHNALQELKGNIRVFCRVRPSVQQGDSVIQVNEAAQSIRLNHGTEAPYDFSFDTLFGTGSGQADVFDEVSGLVQSALDGYKVCIFAYGQTGSGKTYTMQGGREPSSWGLVPRALKQILDTSGEMRSKGWTWSLTASFLEVYNEGIYDLLHKDEKGVEPVHTIIHDEEWGLLVTNMTSEVVGSMNEITNLMNIAARKRAVGNTDMNATSSRSHAVFALYMKGVNEELQTELRGALHLVDLAGSERLDKSGATGSRLKETQNINKSLSCLADVFLAKAEGRDHVPFRNSKLTHLMEPCLSGSGKTLMFVNVGPEEDHAHESLCSLRFAKQVSQCHTGKPKKSARMAGASSNPPSRAATPPSRAGTPRGRAAPSSSSSRPTTPFGF